MRDAVCVGKVEDGVRRSRSMRIEDHGSTARARMVVCVFSAFEFEFRRTLSSGSVYIR